MYRFRSFRWAVALPLFAALQCAPARGAVVYVNKNATSTVRDGKSWSTAFTTVQNGINASTNGGEVWVAQGTYVENLLIPAATQVSLYGRFVGWEVERSQRSLGPEVTVIDGNRTGIVVRIEAGNVTVDGFTITHGSNGVTCHGANVVITHNIIRENYASGSYGGGIDCASANAVIEGNSIVSNSTVGSTFDSGFCCGGASTIAYGGGLVISGNNLRIAGNTISDNAVNPTLSNPGWYSGTDASGGGLYCSGSNVTIIGNVIARNRCRAVDYTDRSHQYYPAGTASGAGLRVNPTGPFVITDNLIVDNVVTGNLSSSGGGIYVNGVAALSNNTIVRNSAMYDSGAIAPGGALTSTAGNTLTNNIFALNSSPLSISGGNEFNNDVFDKGADFIGSNGNISADPLFANSPAGDFRLKAGSPCINTGNDNVIGPTDKDLDGRSRVLGAHVDIGAYEFGPDRVYVSETALGPAHDGASWASAFNQVQEGVDAVSPGGEVWVAKGAYPANGIQVKPDVCLLGGFSGGEFMTAQRDSTANVSLLDGIADSEGFAPAPIITVLGGGVTIDGFTFRNASEFTGSGPAAIPGAAIRYGNYAGRTDIFTISHNDISGCVGSAIYCGVGSIPTISQNRIHDNSGGMEGGGIRLNGSQATIKNNLVTENSATSLAGGIRVYASSAWIINNTIAQGPSGSAINIASFGQNVVCANNLIAFNAGGIGADPGTNAGVVKWRSNNVSKNTAWDFNGFAVVPIGTYGNISVDPQFVNKEAGNYHLWGGSSCIEAGDDSYVQPGETDLDGNPRKQGAHVDMGCFEYPSSATVTLADVAGTLRVVGGLWSGTPNAMNRMNPDGNSLLDLRDAIHLARKVAGLDW